MAQSISSLARARTRRYCFMVLNVARNRAINSLLPTSSRAPREDSSSSHLPHQRRDLMQVRDYFPRVLLHRLSWSEQIWNKDCA